MSFGDIVESSKTVTEESEVEKEEHNLFNDILNDVIVQKPLDDQILIREFKKQYPGWKIRPLLHLMMFEYQEYISQDLDVAQEDVFEYFT